MKVFRVRIKTHCSACPFSGTCSQCNGHGWYYMFHDVSESDIQELT